MLMVTWSEVAMSADGCGSEDCSCPAVVRLGNYRSTWWDRLVALSEGFFGFSETFELVCVTCFAHIQALGF